MVQVSEVYTVHLQTCQFSKPENPQAFSHSLAMLQAQPAHPGCQDDLGLSGLQPWMQKFWRWLEQVIALRKLRWMNVWTTVCPQRMHWREWC